MTNARFKVGDWVRIARVDEAYSLNVMYADYLKLVGTVTTVLKVNIDNYELNMKKSPCWRDGELEPAKNVGIVNIINALDVTSDDAL